MIWLTGELLLLLIAANGSPVLVAKLLGERCNWPIDGGLRLWDGRPLLGASKTWRGLAAAVLSTALMSALVGLGGWFGAFFGLMAMLGDMLSSFLKRRLGLTASTRATGIDQVPEAVLPLWSGMIFINYGYAVLVLGTVVFFLMETVASPLLYRLGICQRPY